MTTAEAREKLKTHGLTDDQAVGVVDLLEVWGQERAVTKDYLDARLTETVAGLRKDLADLRVEFSDKLREQTRWLTSTFVVLMPAAVIRQHFWR
jgi:hypothetical protein